MNKPASKTAAQPCGLPTCGVTRACCRSDCPISMTANGWEGNWEWSRKDGLPLMRGPTRSEFADMKEQAVKWGQEAANNLLADRGIDDGH